jgi:ADP-ribosyl-[dinitrogen reductase] hydrolase
MESDVRSSLATVRDRVRGSALWAFHSTDDFAAGALLAVSLGDDADTTGAIDGQLAGAYYGESGIPREWRERIALRDVVEGYAERLFELSVV